MMEALGVASSVIAVLQLTYSVTTVCHEYRFKIRTRSSLIHTLTTEIQHLNSLLKEIYDLEIGNPGKFPRVAQLFEKDGIMNQCEEILKNLQTQMENSIYATKTKTKKFKTVLSWPLKEKEIQDALVVIERHKTAFSIALEADSLININLLREQFAKKDTDETRKNILRWLSTIDPSSSHAEACKQRVFGTGDWLIDSDLYQKWKNYYTKSRTQVPFMWIYGIPGSGKTLICSKIIDDLEGTVKAPGRALACFYFDFSDKAGQIARSILSSLLAQLCRQKAIIPDCVRDLYGNCDHGFAQPQENQLFSALCGIIAEFSVVFIVIDALDECSEQEALMDFLGQIIHKHPDKLHLLITSRRERDIEEGLSIHAPVKIELEESFIHEDIRKYVNNRLRKDVKLKRLSPAIKQEIETVLLNDAKGMFLWVVRQMDSLQKCNRPAAVKDALQRLPKTLDETYERILLRIQADESVASDALMALQWLTFSARPLKITEVAEALAVTPGCTFIDDESRLFDPKEILSILPGLVTLHDDEFQRLRLSHFSVKEYLISDRIKMSPAQLFAIEKVSANKLIAQVCLTYLLVQDDPDMFSKASRMDKGARNSADFERDEESFNPEFTAENNSKICSETPDKINDKLIYQTFPLLRYSSRYWSKHVRALPIMVAADLTKDILDLLNTENTCYLNWVRAANDPFWPNSFARTLDECDPPLYFAAVLGLSNITDVMLERGEKCFTQVSANERYGHSPEHLTAEQDCDKVGILDAKAYCKARWRHVHGSPLHEAISRGHKEVVQVLFKHGARLDEMQYGDCPLAMACHAGRIEIVKFLLDQGADVNWPPQVDCVCWLPLAKAANRRHYDIVKLLIEKGADVDACGGIMGNALQMAARAGDYEIVKLLLDSGADPNEPGTVFRTALGNAVGGGDSEENKLKIIKLLLSYGARVDYGGGRGDYPFHLACALGNKQVIELLLENGADINKLDDFGTTPLFDACHCGGVEIVRFLLQLGADIHLRGDNAMSPAMAAVESKNVELVKELIDHGAELIGKSGSSDDALYIAAMRWDIKMVKYLLSIGLTPNPEPVGKFCTPLQPAALRRVIPLLQILLDAGADINAHGGRWGDTLRPAAFFGFADVVKFLLDHGADVNYQGGLALNALNAAHKGYGGPHNGVIRILKDHGALEIPNEPEWYTDWIDSDAELDCDSSSDHYRDDESVNLSGDDVD